MLNHFELRINDRFVMLVDFEYDDVYCSLYRKTCYEFDLIQKKNFKKESRNEIECIKLAFDFFSEYTILIEE